MQQAESKNDKKGSVLLLTLIITMIILTSSVVLGTLIISSLRRSQDETVSTSAFYAAESSVEQALYAIRKDKTVPENIERDTCDPPFPANSFPGVDNAGCHVKVDSIKTATLGRTVNKNQTLEYELIDSDGTTVSAGIDKLKIYCVNINAWMDVTLIPISYFASGDQWMPKPDDTKKYLFPCYLSNYNNNFYLIEDLYTNYSYRAVLKVLYENASNVDLRAYSGGILPANEVGVGGKFTVRAWADYSVFSRQEIKVEMKGISTISSLFDYVLYSEQSIVKDVLPGSS